MKLLDLAVPIGAMALGVSLVLFAQHEHARADKFAQLDDQHRACVGAVKTGPAGVLTADRLCDPAIAVANLTSVQSKACDQSLAARPENVFGVRSTCSSPVKTVVAQRDAALSNLEGVKAELQTTRAGQAQAIRRAEARVQTEAQRKANAVAALARAPRDADGLVVCDADCLRRRAGGS